MRSLYMTGYLDDMTGYGQQNCRLIEGFQANGIQVSCFPTGLSEKPRRISDNVRRTIVQTPQPHPELVIQPPSFRPYHKNVERVWLVVWESTKLDQNWVKKIDQCSAVVTPCDWTATALSACGVEAPIYKIPLFLPTPYSYVPPAERDVFVFGCSGHLSSQAPRKNLGAAVQAFLTAFPGDPDVRLHIKMGEQDYLELPDDRRIIATRGYLEPEAMKQWYCDLDVFVHPAKSEGWGFQPLQAMALGRPVIACKYSGLAEYFSWDSGYEINYGYQPCSEMYQNMGHWAEPDVGHMAFLMRHAYQNRDEVKAKGGMAAQIASRFTLTRTLSSLIPVLQKHGVIIDA